MSEARLIGSHIKLANANLLAVKKIGTSDHTAPTLMFYAAENLLMAIFTSEGIDSGGARRKHGNHQLDRMLDELPDTCTIKSDFQNVVDLVAYSTTYKYPTPTGRIPKPPAEEDARGYFDLLVEILDICRRNFQVDLTLEDPEAGSVSPIR